MAVVSLMSVALFSTGTRQDTSATYVDTAVGAARQTGSEAVGGSRGRGGSVPREAPAGLRARGEVRASRPARALHAHSGCPTPHVCSTKQLDARERMHRGRRRATG